MNHQCSYCGRYEDEDNGSWDQKWYPYTFFCSVKCQDLYNRGIPAGIDRYGRGLDVGTKVKVVAEGQLNAHIKKLGYEGVIEEINNGVSSIKCLEPTLGNYCYGCIENECLKRID